MSESFSAHFPSHLVHHPLLPGAGEGLGTGQGASRLLTRWDGDLVFRWARPVIVAAAAVPAPPRPSSSILCWCLLSTLSAAHRLCGACGFSQAEMALPQWGTVRFVQVLTYHSPIVVQPFVASTEVVGVPLASDRPITMLHGFSRPAMWSHRSRGVPTYDQQVRLTPVDSCLCKEGCVCSQCEHTHPSHGHASPEHLCSTLRLRAPPHILPLRGVYVGVSAGYQCTPLLLLLAPPFSFRCLA